jgi:hypothetical protein
VERKHVAEALVFGNTKEEKGEILDIEGESSSVTEALLTFEFPKKEEERTWPDHRPLLEKGILPHR